MKDISCDECQLHFENDDNTIYSEFIQNKTSVDDSKDFKVPHRDVYELAKIINETYDELAAEKLSKDLPIRITEKGSYWYLHAACILTPFSSHR